MDRWLLIRLITLACALFLAACQAEIGDECTVSTDCSPAGDRLCATNLPEGYCTIFNCEPGTCPEESVCIGFGTALSRAPGCNDPQGGSRFQRTFCMARCDDDDDCRGGYACEDMGVPNPWGAIVVENGASRGEVNGKVCAVPFQGTPVQSIPGGDAPQVCTGTDAGFDAPPWTSTVPEAGPVTDAGGDADASGEGGAAGMGGAGGVSGADAG